MLEAVINDRGLSNVSTIAARVAMPVATAHRQVATLLAQGYLVSIGRGRHMAGPKLRGLVSRIDQKEIFAASAAPFLHELAARARGVVHLGTLEGDMVTYRLKVGRNANALFTRIDMQLEAYCSAIGKILLAHLSEPEREAYIAAGPFIPLTPATITDSARLRAELNEIRDQGFALDRGEIADNLFCVAVPISHGLNEELAAISISRVGKSGAYVNRDQDLIMLRETVRAIERTEHVPE